MPDPPTNVYLVALEANSIDDAFYQAAQTVGFYATPAGLAECRPPRASIPDWTSGW
jgi:hypothetical protein